MKNKEEYLKFLTTKLNAYQFALMTPNIYYNPKHVDYYMAYKIGDYEECWDYLSKNLDDLKLSKTPKEFKISAKNNVKNKDLLYSYYAE